MTNHTTKERRLLGKAKLQNKTFDNWSKVCPSSNGNLNDLGSNLDTTLLRSKYLRELSSLTKKWLSLHELLDYPEASETLSFSANPNYKVLLLEILEDLNVLSDKYPFYDSQSSDQILDQIGVILEKECELV